MDEAPPRRARGLAAKNQHDATSAAVNPIDQVIELVVQIGMVHDAGEARGRMQSLAAAFPGADAVIFGHTHSAQHEEEGGVQIFNPGSPTVRRRAPTHTMGIARIEGGKISFEHVSVG